MGDQQPTPPMQPTTPSMQPTNPPPMAPAPPPTTTLSTPSFMASMSQTDMLIAGGAALLVLTDLYSIFVAYGVSSIAWAAAAASLVLILLRDRMPASVMSNYRPILVLLSTIVVLIALRQVLIDVKFIATPPAGLSVERLIGMVGYYAGVGLMGFGAWRLWKAMPA